MKPSNKVYFSFFFLKAAKKHLPPCFLFCCWPTTYFMLWDCESAPASLPPECLLFPYRWWRVCCVVLYIEGEAHRSLMFCQPVRQFSYFLSGDGARLLFQRNNKTYEIFSLLVSCLSLSPLHSVLFPLKDIYKATVPHRNNTHLKNGSWFW